METVTGIDMAGRAVLVGDRHVPYDFLIIATGARHVAYGREARGYAAGHALI
jgi:NADH dehydrogenase